MRRQAYLVSFLVLILAGLAWGFDGSSSPFPSKAMDVQTQCATVKGAAAEDDYPGLFRFVDAATLRAWHCIQAGATKVIGGVDNCDGNATNCHAVSIDGNCTTVEFDNSTLNSYMSVGSGGYVGFHTTSVTGTNTWVTVCVDYTID
jgi:hypothetical protein